MGGMKDNVSYKFLAKTEDVFFQALWVLEEATKHTYKKTWNYKR